MSTTVRSLGGRLLLSVLAVVAAREARPDGGGILVQASGDQLITGFDNEAGGMQTIGDRAFSLLFPSDLANDVPSFLSLQSPPPGSEPLPVGGELFWDFLPMTVGDVTSNLLYWDAVGNTPGEVEFGAVPQAGVTLSIWTELFLDHAAVDGAAEMVPGKRIGKITANSTSLHAHRWFFMEAPTGVPEGAYLVALQLRMEGFRGTEPIYIVAATDGVSATTLDGIALPWVAERVDDLVLRGDYDFDGDVDAGDYAVWRQQFGMGGPFPQGRLYADGNRDGRVNAADYTVWRDNLGIGAAARLAPHAVPEPTSAAILWVSLAVAGWRLRRRSLCRHTPRQQTGVEWPWWGVGVTLRAYPKSPL